MSKAKGTACCCRRALMKSVPSCVGKRGQWRQQEGGAAAETVKSVFSPCG